MNDHSYKEDMNDNNCKDNSFGQARDIRNDLERLTNLINEFNNSYDISNNEVIPKNENDELFLLNKELNSLESSLNDYLQLLCSPALNIKILYFKFLEIIALFNNIMILIKPF